jgi:hypothetical protein
MVTAVERSAVADATESLHGFHGALTSFVGRARVVGEVAGRLGQYRLVAVAAVHFVWGSRQLTVARSAPYRTGPVDPRRQRR